MLFPVVYKSYLLFGASDGFFYFFDLLSGKQKWSFKTNAVIKSQPLIGGKTVFFNSRDGFYYALNVDDRKVIWKRKNNLSNGYAIVSNQKIFILSLRSLKVLNTFKN